MSFPAQFPQGRLKFSSQFKSMFYGVNRGPPKFNCSKNKLQNDGTRQVLGCLLAVLPPSSKGAPFGGPGPFKKAKGTPKQDIPHIPHMNTAPRPGGRTSGMTWATTWATTWSRKIRVRHPSSIFQSSISLFFSSYDFLQMYCADPQGLDPPGFPHISYEKQSSENGGGGGGGSGCGSHLKTSPLKHKEPLRLVGFLLGFRLQPIQENAKLRQLRQHHAVESTPCNVHSGLEP